MLLPSIILIGLGWALAFPALNVQATAGVAGREQGLAAGLFNTTFQIGGAVGVAIVSTVISSHKPAAGSETQAVAASIRPALIILIPVALAGVAVLAALTGRSPTATDTTTEAELASIARGGALASRSGKWRTPRWPFQPQSPVAGRVRFSGRERRPPEYPSS